MDTSFMGGGYNPAAEMMEAAAKTQAAYVKKQARLAGMRARARERIARYELLMKEIVESPPDFSLEKLKARNLFGNVAPLGRELAGHIRGRVLKLASMMPGGDDLRSVAAMLVSVLHEIKSTNEKMAEAVTGLATEAAIAREAAYLICKDDKDGALRLLEG